MMRKHIPAKLLVLLGTLALGLCPVFLAQDPTPDNGPLTIDHYVRVKSTVPSMAGQTAQLYMRERVLAGTVARATLTDRVVLFVHGAGTPAEVAFDTPYQDYSWMAFLAQAGYDVFSVDMTGYGRSTRPTVMNDPCNLTEAQQKTFVPQFLPAPCAATQTKHGTTIASDHNDIGAAVDYIRNLRRVEKVHLVGWSLGGPRAGGFAAANPGKVSKLVLLAPAYNRTTSTEPPAAVPANGAPFNTQSHEEFVANWDRQLGCPNQFDPLAREAVWKAMMESDPVGATWGTGVRRAPNTTNWGWSTAVVAKMQTPTLMIAAALDRQVDPKNVRDFYADLGAKQKVLIDLGCASHNAMWERAHQTLFKASLEWLSKGTVNGKQEGALQAGIDGFSAP
jgi:pimeloyl-ACP methyl ester carboxylesterase